jgi:hypothetical protein
MLNQLAGRISVIIVPLLSPLHVKTLSKIFRFLKLSALYGSFTQTGKNIYTKLYFAFPESFLHIQKIRMYKTSLIFIAKISFLK